MTKLKITAALFSLAAAASPAFAQDFVDATIQELVAQGYTHFEVSRGLLSTEIDAYGPNFTNLEIQLSNADGSVISQSSEVETQAEYEQNISEINQLSSNIREDGDTDGYEVDDRDGYDRDGGDHDGDDHDGGDHDGGDHDGGDHDSGDHDGGDHDGGDHDGGDHDGGDHDGGDHDSGDHDGGDHDGGDHDDDDD